MKHPRIVLDLGGLDLLWPGAGLYRYVVDLLRALHDLSPPARFIVLGSTPEPIEDLRPVFGGGAGAWRYLAFPRAAGFAAQYRDQVRMTVTLARARANLCHCLHTCAPVVAPCPVVVTIQDMMFELFPEYALAVRSRPYRLFKWVVRHRARRVICASHNTRADVARLWRVSADKLDVVHHGLRVFGHGAGPVGEPANDQLRQLGAGPILTSPLNLEPRKNLITLLEAYALLRPRFPAARLVVYGKGGWSDERERKYREDLSRLNLAGSVIAPGVLSDADLWWLYQRASLFVFPTLYEGFGYPALEAMAAGTCVVVRGCSSMAELVGETGVQVEPLTPLTLAEAVGGLLADEPRRRRLGAAARARASQFTSERMARGTFATYLGALRVAEAVQ